MSSYFLISSSEVLISEIHFHMLLVKYILKCALDKEIPFFEKPFHIKYPNN